MTAIIHKKGSETVESHDCERVEQDRHFILVWQRYGYLMLSRETHRLCGTIY